MSTNLSKYLRRKTRAMPRWVKASWIFLAFIFLPFMIYYFSFVICAIRYDLKSLEYHIDYCVARDYTPYKYHYHWFNGNPLMHSYLSTWLGYHALDTTFYSYDEKEGEFFSENPAPKQLGQFDFRIFCRNAEKYIIEARPRMKSLLRSMRRVEKTDYLRYLNIFVDGGIYSDADVELVMPIKWWLTTFGFAAYKIDELDFVIGLEFAHPMNYLNNRWRGLIFFATIIFDESHMYQDEYHHHHSISILPMVLCGKERKLSLSKSGWRNWAKYNWCCSSKVFYFVSHSVCLNFSVSFKMKLC